MDTSLQYTPPNNIYFLKNFINQHLINKLRSGDPIRDTIIACLIISMQDTFTSYLAVLKEYLLKSPWLTYRFVCWMVRMYYSKRQPQIIKEAKVKYITDSREINTLFEPISWYLNTQTNTKQESEVALETTKNQPHVMQKIPKQRTAKINFLDHEISYETSTEMITIYAEREHQRENIIITLQTKTPKNRTADIFQQFSEMCQKKYEEFNKKKQWAQKIHRNEQGVWKAQDSKTSRKLSTVILKKGQMEDITDDINDFIHKEEWYVSRDVPYTRRYMFWGLPGTGKSSCIRALASHTKRHIHYLVLSEVQSDNELFQLFEQINFQETILVIEDIDCASDVTHERDTVPNDDDKDDEKETSNKKLTLSGLLNAIDGGIVENHGQIMIITTNHPDKLDKALIRPGRIDRKFEFGLCDTHQIEGLFFNFFEQYPREDRRGIFPQNTVSPADITGLLLQYKKNPDDAWERVRERWLMK